MIMKKLATIILILVGILSLLSCSKTDELSVLNNRIDKLVTVIEEKDPHQVKHFLASDFSAANNLNKARFTIFMQYQLKRHKNVIVTVTDKNVVLNKTHADVIAKVLLIGAGDWLPERGQLYKIESRWTKEGDDWLLSRLRWEKSGINE